MFAYKSLKKSEIQELISKLSFFYNCKLENLKSYYFYITNREKIYISKINMQNLEIENINSIGLYFGAFHDKNRFRLSLEGSKFVKPLKNFVKIDEKTFKSYACAENLFKEEVIELNHQDKCPFLIITYNDENLGSISVKDDILLNYLPKSRKLDFNKVF